MMIVRLILALRIKKQKKLVELGEYAVFDTKYDHFGDKLLKGKALMIE